MNKTPIERIAELIGDDPKTVIDNYSHFIDERQPGLDKSQEITFDDAELVLLGVKTEEDRLSFLDEKTKLLF